MDATDTANTSRKPSLLLALLGLLLAGGMSVLFFKDVTKSLRSASEAHDAEAQAQKALAQLTAENGWFPFVRDPIYDFQDNAQGWTLQDEIVESTVASRGFFPCSIAASTLINPATPAAVIK